MSRECDATESAAISYSIQSQLVTKYWLYADHTGVAYARTAIGSTNNWKAHDLAAKHCLS